MVLAEIAAGDPPHAALVAVVVILACVQSIFGVGLLVFGTPILLLMGLPFGSVLAYLLPCSLVVSALQVASAQSRRLDAFRRDFLVLCVPVLALVTLLALHAGKPSVVKLGVGIVLLGSAALRLLGPARGRVAALVQRHRKRLFVLLGVVHGASNLGGGLLTAFAASTFVEKSHIRNSVAFCYGVMATVQLAVLWTTSRPEVGPGLVLLLPVLAALTYLVVGRRLFAAAGQGVYQLGLTALIATFGVLVLVQA